jgi:hypothetical protein
LENEELIAPFLTYTIQVAEVSGEFSDIVELFVRINSTGKALSSSEKRHARFYTSPFLKEADRLARKHQDYLVHQQIVSQTEIDRMKDVELISELLASIVAGSPIHKKQAVDRAVGNQSINAHTLRKTVDELVMTINQIKRMFPELRTTRFRNMSEFYSLFLVVWELEQQKLILKDHSRNSVAMSILQKFSNGVDSVRERQRNAEGAKSSERLFADYLLLVQQSTDSLAPRKRRAEIIRSLFSGLFERKDERRIFSSEQRRLLWSSEEQKTCSQCGDLLDWTNFQMDHVKAHSRGGKTELKNAALICATCNPSKSSGRAAKKAIRLK